MSDTTTPFESDFDDPRSVQLAEGMRAQGVEPYAKVQVDYFASTDDVRTMLPDGVSWVSHKLLMEGDRKKYMKVVNRDMKIQKGTGDAIMRLAAGEDRTALLDVAITGWSLVKDGEDFPYNEKNKRAFLEGPVRILQIIEADVKKNNPWLLAEASSEDIQAEIDTLLEQLDLAKEREAGKATS